MEQFVWSMEGEPVKDLFRYVLMESGDMCVDMVGILILTMQEWCVANWDTLQQVFMFMNYCSTIIILLGNSVYSASIICSLEVIHLNHIMFQYCKNTGYNNPRIGGVICEGNF